MLSPATGSASLRLGGRRMTHHPPLGRVAALSYSGAQNQQLPMPSVSASSSISATSSSTSSSSSSCRLTACRQYHQNHHNHHQRQSHYEQRHSKAFHAPPLSASSAVRQTQLHHQQMPSTSSSSSSSAAAAAPGVAAATSNHPQRRTFTSINQATPYTLCFLRHGQSTWNRDNRFIGWTDTPLTDDGVLEARIAGKMLANSGILFDEVHTSLLRRSIRTVNLVLMEMGQEYLPVHKHWRLNERNYGELVGKNKKETVKMHGKEQVKRWRRSYDEPPPPMCPEHEYHPAKDPRYRHMLDLIPRSESLQDTKARSSVYWDEAIVPCLKQGKTVLIVGHENNLRSLIMKLEDIPKEDVINLCLPRAVPLAYRLDENFKPLDRPDGKLDEATGFLRGEWLGGDAAVAEILDRDRKQVYDTTVEKNLETCESPKKWTDWMNLVVEEPRPEARAN